MALIPYRDDNYSRTTPFVTYLLILVNAYVFVRYGFFSGEGVYAQIVNGYGYTLPGLLKQPQVIITSIFLHANFLHLLSNMWFLHLFGDNIEDKFGRINFLWMYIMAGIIGNLAHSLFTILMPQVPVIGASGAVAGVMGAYVVKYPSAKIRTIFFLWIYPIFFKIAAFWFIGIWMFFEFAAAFMSPHDQIAHWAHIGGFLFGALWAKGRKGVVHKKRFLAR
ncbi:rhomboid family intramembrane serine protease [Calditrichota bacterium]